MTDDSRLRILASEHLPDGVASEIEFLEFFRHLLRATGNDLEAQETQVRVVCWLVPGSVHHYIVVRESRTGRLRCRLEIAIAARVSGRAGSARDSSRAHVGRSTQLGVHPAAAG